MSESVGRADDGAGPSESGRRKPWVFDVAWIGAAGIALFVLVRFPMATFYSKLGTNPEEVGLDYRHLLTQASPGIAVLLALGGLGYWWITRLPDDPRMARWFNEPYDTPRPDLGRKTLQSLDDEAFEARMREAQEYWSHTVRDRKIFEQEAPLLRRLRALDRDKVRRPTEIREVLHSFYSDIPAAEWATKRRWEAAAVVTAFALFLFGYLFPDMAGDVADDVRNCGEGFTVPGFELGGQHVRLFDGTAQTQRFTDRELILLGGDANRYILYDCRNQTTLRVPTAGTVVVNGS